MTTTTLSRALAVIAALAAASLLTGCGSSSSSSKTPESAAASSSTASRTALQACLRKHSVTLPNRGAQPGGPPTGAPGAGSAAPPNGEPPPGAGAGGGAPSAKLQAAFKACGANFPARRPSAAFSRQTIQKYVSCVRQHGYNLPKPNFSGQGPTFSSSIRSNKKFQAASKACQGLLAPPTSGASASGA